jgi:hypothetical protein
MPRRRRAATARSGAPDNWIRFVGEGPGVILDGGETIPTDSGWTEAGDGVWSRPYARNPRYLALAYGVLLDGLSYIEVRNLEVDHYEEMGVRFRNSHHSALRDSVIHDSRQMVYVDRERSTDNLTEGNRIFGSGVLEWPWDICHHDHDCSSRSTTAGPRRASATSIF